MHGRKAYTLRVKSVNTLTAPIPTNYCVIFYFERLRLFTSEPHYESWVLASLGWVTPGAATERVTPLFFS